MGEILDSLDSLEGRFADLVERFGMADLYGLARVRRWPPLPAEHVYLETEKSGRALQVRVVPRDEVQGGVNSLWYFETEPDGRSRLVPVQPCVHAAESMSSFQDMDGTNIPAAHEAFAAAVVELFSRYGVQQQLALARNHRHFEMTDEEVLVESPASDGTLIITIMARSAVRDADPVLWCFEPLTRALRPMQYVAHARL